MKNCNRMIDKVKLCNSVEHYSSELSGGRKVDNSSKKVECKDMNVNDRQINNNEVKETEKKSMFKDDDGVLQTEKLFLREESNSRHKSMSKSGRMDSSSNLTSKQSLKDCFFSSCNSFCDSAVLECRASSVSMSSSCVSNSAKPQCKESVGRVSFEKCSNVGCAASFLPESFSCGNLFGAEKYKNDSCLCCSSKKSLHSTINNNDKVDANNHDNKVVSTNNSNNINNNKIVITNNNKNMNNNNNKTLITSNNSYSNENDSNCYSAQNANNKCIEVFEIGPHSAHGVCSGTPSSLSSCGTSSSSISISSFFLSPACGASPPAGNAASGAGGQLTCGDEGASSSRHSADTTCASCENSSEDFGGIPSAGRRKRTAVQTPNDIWKERLKFLEPYFDVETILTLKQTAKVFSRHKYKPYNNVLSFTSFRGYECKVIIDKVLSSICRSVHSSIRDKLRLDFRECTLIKDATLAKLVDLSYGVRTQNALLANIHTLNFDYCYQVTDKGLSALLTTHLPFLEELSLCSARNKELTGAPFITYLSTQTWPLFTQFYCSFTNMWLDSLNFVADFCTKRAVQLNRKPHIEIFGSWASKCLFQMLGLGGMSKTFCHAVKGKDHQLASKLTKAMQKELLEIGNREQWLDNALVQLVKSYGSQLLVNAPLTIETSEDGGVNVWTLPISIAIQTQDHDTFNLLIKRGAKVDVCDYLGKSPIFRACEVDREDFVEVLLSQGASPTPHDLLGPSPLHIAIKHKNTHIVNLLLKHGAVLDCKCPAIRAYKSALYIACEVNAPEIIQLFLENGADPNWSSNNKFTPALLAYQINSAWLPHFLGVNADLTTKRWVLTEIMSCAIMKCDMQSVMILIKRYKDLLHKSHPMWSKPHIQASKLGKYKILEYLLSAGADVNARGLDGKTALHAATEEDYLECVKLLLCKNADINQTNNDGQGAIHIACLENRLEVAECLLRKGCDVNTKDKALGETPLMICIRMRNEKMALLILSLSQNQQCDAVGAQGRTALMYAMFFGQYSVADKLMEKGADVTIKDHQGNCAYFVVCERMLTPGSDKKVLRRYLNLYRASGRRNATSMFSAAIKNSFGNHNNSNLCIPPSSINCQKFSGAFHCMPSIVEESQSTSRSDSDPQSEKKVNESVASTSTSNDELINSTRANRRTNQKGISLLNSSSLSKTGKKLKLEPKAVFSVAKGLPTAILKAVKAK